MSEPIPCVRKSHAAFLQGRFPETRLFNGLMAAIGERAGRARRMA